MFAVRKNAGYDLLGYLRSVEQRGSEVKFVILAICTGERETPECGWGDHPKLFDQMRIRRLLPCVANGNKPQPRFMNFTGGNPERTFKLLSPNAFATFSGSGRSMSIPGTGPTTHKARAPD